MKMTFIANACCIYEEKGYKLLCDPWLKDGAFEGSWFHYPPLRAKFKNIEDVNAIWISHIHPDHYCETTLKRFTELSVQPTIFIYKDKLSLLRKKLEALGFKKIRELKEREPGLAGPFTLQFFGPFATHPFYEETSEIGNIIDSAMLLQTTSSAVLNTCDNNPSMSAAIKLKNYLDGVKINLDLLQINYNAAGPYPACFSNLSEEEKLAKHGEIIHKHLKHMADIEKVLKPKRTMPFAGQYILGGKLWEKNRYLGTTSWDTAALALERPLLLQEGNSYDFEDEETMMPYRAIPWEDALAYAKTLADVSYPYEFDQGAPSLTHLFEALKQARENLYRQQQKFDFFPDIDVFIKMPHSLYFKINMISGTGLFVTDDVTTNQKLTCSMHPGLLWQILNRTAHWNNAEIGCHIEFDRVPDVFNFDLHMMLSFFHV